MNSPCGVPGGVKEGLQSAAIMTLLHNINILQSAPRYNRTHTSGITTCLNYTKQGIFSLQVLAAQFTLHFRGNAEELEVP